MANINYKGFSGTLINAGLKVASCCESKFDPTVVKSNHISCYLSDNLRPIQIQEVMIKEERLIGNCTAAEIEHGERKHLLVKREWHSTFCLFSLSFSSSNRDTLFSSSLV